MLFIQKPVQCLSTEKCIYIIVHNDNTKYQYQIEYILYYIIFVDVGYNACILKYTKYVKLRIF